MMCFLCPALAEYDLEALISVETTFIHYGDYGNPIGDLQKLLNIKFLNDDRDTEPYFGDATIEALIKFQEGNGLEITGHFDEETLRAMLKPGRVEEADRIVWVPMHGGKKCHLKENCSSMVEPRQMPRDCANALGFDPCGRCYK